FGQRSRMRELSRAPPMAPTPKQPRMMPYENAPPPMRSRVTRGNSARTETAAKPKTKLRNMTFSRFGDIEMYRKPAETALPSDSRGRLRADLSDFQRSKARMSAI